ncbi:MAG: hypothetical protein LRY71_01145 [Bacillaceae bacterium]|nr:hypothetical protein [Bacillaceae bacterium]
MNPCCMPGYVAPTQEFIQNPCQCQPIPCPTPIPYYPPVAPYTQGRSGFGAAIVIVVVILLIIFGLWYSSNHKPR